ncbi:IS66 family insertion sequence element accessory protein TnpA [Nitrincola alkalisediminis]
MITQWQDSDLSAAFCRNQSVNYEQFNYWKKSLTTNLSDVAMQPSSQHTSGFTRVTQVKHHEPTHNLTLSLPSGISISGLQSNNIHLLSDILRQL